MHVQCSVYCELVYCVQLKYAYKLVLVAIFAGSPHGSRATHFPLLFSSRLTLHTALLHSHFNLAFIRIFKLKIAYPIIFINILSYCIVCMIFYILLNFDRSLFFLHPKPQYFRPLYTKKCQM